MAAIRFLSCMLVALFIAGCGQMVHETLQVPADPLPAAACPRTIVVLPFADYFYSDNLQAGLIRNSLVMEYLSDRLTARGAKVPVHDDVLRYLADHKLVDLLPPESAQAQSQGNVRSLRKELREEWSVPMKEEITRYIEAEAGRRPKVEKNPEEVLAAPGIYSLDKKEVQELGRYFQADYLIRGRIIEYALKPGSPGSFLYTPDQAVVHLQVWAQSTTTGEVVWTNRIKVQVAPQSELAADRDALFSTALDRAAASLIDDFCNKVSG